MTATAIVCYNCDAISRKSGVHISRNIILAYNCYLDIILLCDRLINEMRRDDTLRTSLQINFSTRYAYCNSYFFLVSPREKSPRRVANHLTLLGFLYTMEEVSDERETGIMTHGITYNYS